MMAKHTEGPWTVEQPMDFEFTVVEDNGKDPADWRFIASCCFSDPDDPNPISRAQVEANAHLIAAAPELLEALENLLAECPEAWSRHGAQAAIAKARGEA